MTTVRVRIAVGVDARGVWCAYGWSSEQGRQATDEQMAGNVADMIDQSVTQYATHYIEADVPLPESTTVKGEVK